MTTDPGTADLDAVLGDILAAARASTDRGRVADYIPELAGVDPGQFGLSVALADGSQHSVGDADVPFSIQSVSKVFALAIALGRLGDPRLVRGHGHCGLAHNDRRLRSSRCDMGAQRRSNTSLRSVRARDHGHRVVRNGHPGDGRALHPVGHDC